MVTGCNTSSTDPEVKNNNFPSENLENARTYALDENNGRALIIWHDGDIILEDYAENFDGQQLHSIWSSSKSFAGLLVAIAVKNGLFKIDGRRGSNDSTIVHWLFLSIITNY